ncbi:MAG: terminase TerL endonuclease subunit [Verrucomicrobiota bacterium]
MPAKRSAAPADDPATAYARAVIAGTAAAGKLVRQACERHLRDLERQGTAEFPFVWEPARGDIFARFCLLLRHYKGRFKNQPFELAPFQQFISGNVFGWVHKDTKLRRFRTAVIRVPRKNGKTAFAAALALYLLSMDGESGAEVYFAATRRDQARLGWSDATKFLKYSPKIVRARFVEKQNLLEFPSTDGKLVPLSGDSETQDGLNPHAALCDETHQWPDRSLWDALEDGMGAREQPLMVDISTAGTNTASFAYETHKRGEDVLSGTLEDDSFFCYIAMADKEDEGNFKDPAVWEKANPGLGAIKSYDYMRQQLKVVEATPSKLTTFLTKQLNVWTNSAERWLDPDDWKRGNMADLMEKLKGRKCHGALDLGKVNDLSAFTLTFPPEEVFAVLGVKKHALLAWHFCPADDIPRRSKEHRVPYDAWQRAGLIEMMPGNTTDFGFIRHRITEICPGYQVQDVAFDRMFAGETVQGLQEAGITMVEFGQGFVSMAGPTSEFERLVKAGNLLHADSPLLAWEAGNVCCELDAAGNIKPSKKKSREKIDGIVSGIMSLGRCMAQEKAAVVPTVWVA